MRKTLMAAGLAAVVMAGPARAEDAQRDSVFGLTESELQSIGCLAYGTTATAVATAMGPYEIVALIGGAGTVMLPSSPVVAVTAVGALVFASFCSVGQAVTPAAVLAYHVTADQINNGGWGSWAGERWAAARNVDVSGSLYAAASAVGGFWGAASTMVAGLLQSEPAVPSVDDDLVRLAQVELLPASRVMAAVH